MPFKPVSSLRRGLGSFWRGIDATRRFVFNLLFLLILIFLLWAMFGGGIKPLAPNTALVLDLKGELVEEKAGSVRDSVVAGLSGNARHLIQLRDVGAAVERVKAAGKKVVAWGGTYDQKRYMVASHASEIYLHPMGMVLIEGFGRHRNYYRDALDKVGVTVNLMKVGTYKSFAEPYIGNGPSPAALEADSFLYNALWANYTAEVEKARKLPAGSIAKGIEELPQRMAAANGHAGKVALDWKLIDGLKTRDEVRALMIKRGAWDEAAKSFRQVSFQDYLSRHPP